MQSQGLLPDGVKSLVADRMKTEQENDPDNCLPVYLELANMKKEIEE